MCSTRRASASGSSTWCSPTPAINRGYSLRYADGEIDKFPEQTWHEVLDVNLFGTISTIRSAAAIMKEQGSGSIIVDGVDLGYDPDPMVGYPYMTSKTAIISIVRQASIELAPYGVQAQRDLARFGASRTSPRAAPSPRTTSSSWEDTIPMGRSRHAGRAQGRGAAARLARRRASSPARPGRSTAARRFADQGPDVRCRANPCRNPHGKHLTAPGIGDTTGCGATTHKDFNTVTERGPS